MATESTRNIATRSAAADPKSSNAASTTSTPASSVAGSSIQSTQRTVAPKRWAPALPITAAYYYNEPVPPVRQLSKEDEKSAKLFPPRMDLSDAWVVEIVRSDLTGRERAEMYPTVFGSKYLQRDYITMTDRLGCTQSAEKNGYTR